MIEAEEDFYNRVCNRIGLERVNEGHISDDDNDSWDLVSIKKNSSVNGGNAIATDIDQKLNMHFDSEALIMSV